MDCVENENVCSVKKEDNLDFYRIHTIWMKDRFRINIASKNGAWSGEMTPENIKEFSSNLRIDQDKYLTECKEVLTTDDGKKGYLYAVENGCFNWKKMIDEDSGMKVKMGSVMLQPVSFTETLQNIIEVSLKHKKNLKRQVDNLLKNKEANSQRINDLQVKLEELIDKKNIMEGDLYTKFLLLLNSKKRKIQELEEVLYNKKDKTKFEKDGEKQNSDCHLNTQILHPYDMDTEDDSDDHDNVPELKKPEAKCKIKKPHNEKGNSFEYETSKMVTETCPSLKSEESTINTYDNKFIGESDIIPKKKSETISKPTSSNGNNSKNLKKSFPATKDDILDFFFG